MNFIQISPQSCGRIGSANPLAMVVIVLALVARAVSAPVLTETLLTRDQGGLGPVLADESRFGSSIAPMGDMDGDGVTDLAAGATWYPAPPSSGAIFILFLNTDGTVRAQRRLLANDPVLAPYAGATNFGAIIASPGDLDGDGVFELAAVLGPATSSDNGLILLLFMNSDGTIRTTTSISTEYFTLASIEHFPSQLA